MAKYDYDGRKIGRNLSPKNKEELIKEATKKLMEEKAKKRL